MKYRKLNEDRVTLEKPLNSLCPPLVVEEAYEYNDDDAHDGEDDCESEYLEGWDGCYVDLRATLGCFLRLLGATVVATLQRSALLGW